jgi:hypothetical protein
MIKVITCHHHRHKIAELFYLGIDRLKTGMYNVQVYAAITKGDEGSIALAEKYGAKYVLTENNPLGKKWNSAYQLACSSGNKSDDIIILGEDNVLSVQYIDYVYNFGESLTVFGLKTCGIVDLQSKTVKRWTYKDDLQLIGAARIFWQPKPFVVGKPVRPIRIGNYALDVNRDIPLHPGTLNNNGRNIVKAKEIYALWDDKLNSGLDRSSEANLALLGYDSVQFDDGRIHVLDFKSNANIHKFSEFKGCEETDEDWKWFLSDEEKEYLKVNFGL